MDIETLRLFVDVMRLGSFAAAARVHDLDPSSVSRAIAALEEELDVQLFVRDARRLIFTEAAHSYSQRILPVLEELDAARAAAAGETQRPGGRLRISVAVSYGLKRIVPLLPDFLREYPGMSVELEFSDARVDLRAAGFDLALRHGPVEASDHGHERLHGTRYVIVATPLYLKQSESLLAPEELTKIECLLFPYEGFRSRWNFRDPHGTVRVVPVQGRLILSSALALLDACLADLGPALLPDWLIQTELSAGRLVQLFPDFEVSATDFNTAVWLVYAPRDYAPHKTRVFAGFLKARLGDQARESP
jgi:DNA-binding transcriptional LysR family regulator